MSDGTLEQMFLEMVPRHKMEDDPGYRALLSFFPDMEKDLKCKEVTKKQLWKQYRKLNPDDFDSSDFSIFQK